MASAFFSRIRSARFSRLILRNTDDQGLDATLNVHGNATIDKTEVLRRCRAALIDNSKHGPCTNAQIQNLNSKSRWFVRAVLEMPFPGEIAMRNNTTLFDVESSHECPTSRVPEVVRTLVGLIGQVKTPEHPDSLPDSPLEEVLVDTEVDGSRYLLIRMPEPIDTNVRLSPREQEIVRMVAKGHPNKVIADVLNISSWTVCTHLRRIFAKLNVTSRAAMVGRISKIGALNSSRRQDSARFK